VLKTECQNAQMSKIKNGGLDQYSAEPFEQQQFGTAGVEGVNAGFTCTSILTVFEYFPRLNIQRIHHSSHFSMTQYPQ